MAKEDAKLGSDVNSGFLESAAADQKKLLAAFQGNIIQLTNLQAPLPSHTDTKMEKEAIARLSALAAALSDDAEKPKLSPNESHAVILRSFILLTDKWIKEGMPTAQDMHKFIEKLAEDLYGKPPRSAAVRAALLNVFFAILGLVIGALIGAAISGGPGAIPTAIAGAVAGFTNAASAAASAWVYVGAICGLFTVGGAVGPPLSWISYIEKETEYEVLRDQKKEELRPIRTEINHFTSLWKKPEPAATENKLQPAAAKNKPAPTTENKPEPEDIYATDFSPAISL